MTRRLFTACLGTETNTFSPIPTGLGLFGETMMLRGGEYGEPPSPFSLPLVAWRERAQARGWTVAPGLAAFATPAGTTTRAAYEALRDEILADLRAALPVDAVLLSLHGAMIADGYPDAEGDLLTHVRTLVGPQVPVLAELDLHGHLTRAKCAAADVLVFFKEYPHVDIVPRAHEVFTLCERMLDDGLRPTMAMHDCRMLGIYPTTREPMMGFVRQMQSLEQRADVLSVSLAHGFPWGDTPEVGTRVLVITDDDAALAQSLADELGAQVWAGRAELVAPMCTIDQAIDRVLASPAGDAPFVLADTADNTGIGSAGDSTFVLRRLIEREVGGFAISPLWDPVAVTLAFDAGEGARLPMRIGGKLGPGSGDPVDAEVTVMALAQGALQKFGDAMAPLGRVARLRIGPVDDDARAIDVIVNDVRIQAFDPVCFTAVGALPGAMRAWVVKSTQHFHAGFAPVAREVIYMASPGTSPMDMRTLEYGAVTAALWPRVDDPHARA
ncbi:MAG: M81 family metallopeptidase [Burkholderiaceae bacterium]